MRSETFPLGDGLAALAEAEFGAGNRAMQYLQTSLRSHDFDRDTAFALLSAGQGRSGESWMERSLALLFLENQLLRLAPDASWPAAACPAILSQLSAPDSGRNRGTRSLHEIFILVANPIAFARDAPDKLEW